MPAMASEHTPQVTSTSRRDSSTPALVRLVDTAGGDGPATPREVAGRLRAGGFFWLDLENPGDDEMAEFSQSLRLSPGGSLLVGAAIAAALVTPLAPALVRGAVYGITRSLLRDAMPVATRRLAARARSGPPEIVSRL